MNIAASLLLLLSIPVFNRINRNNSDIIYAESYIIRNGVRITDWEVIKPELEETQREVDLQKKECDRLMQEMNEINFEF